MRIAAVQCDVALGEPATNLARMESSTREARAAGADLVCFPECMLTGYCFDSKDEALPFAESVPGPATQHLANVCADVGGHVIFGLLESEGDSLFNAAALVGPRGLLGSYRKVHLPYLGIDRFTTPGDRPFEVLEADGVRIGLLICYDAGFPEATRCLALAGADVVVLPTNWPPGAEIQAQHVCNARAMENHIAMVAVDRVGEERGYRFIGQSSICDVAGRSLAMAGETEETILYADLDPLASRNKKIVRVPEKHLIDRVADRRPEFYGRITEPK